MPPLHECIKKGKDVEAVIDLLSEGESPNSRDSRGRTPLHVALVMSERKFEDRRRLCMIARALIARANLDLVDDCGLSPLHIAVMSQNREMIFVLGNANADINLRNKDGCTALHLACTESSFLRPEGEYKYMPDIRIVKLVLGRNPFIDAQNLRSETPLMFAVRSGNSCIVRELLRKNAAVNLQNSTGDTALHYAVKEPTVNVEIIFELARRGCDFQSVNKAGMTPLDSYIKKLKENHPQAEVEKAKSVLKLFLLKFPNFGEDESKCLKQIDKDNSTCKLLQFLELCYVEMMKMTKDRLKREHKVSNIVLRGAFFSAIQNRNHVPADNYDVLLDRLKKT